MHDQKFKMTMMSPECSFLDIIDGFGDNPSKDPSRKRRSNLEKYEAPCNS